MTARGGAQLSAAAEQLPDTLLPLKESFKDTMNSLVSRKAHPLPERGTVYNTSPQRCWLVEARYCQRGKIKCTRSSHFVKVGPCRLDQDFPAISPELSESGGSQEMNVHKSHTCFTFCAYVLLYVTEKNKHIVEGKLNIG